MFSNIMTALFTNHFISSFNNSVCVISFFFASSLNLIADFTSKEIEEKELGVNSLPPFSCHILDKYTHKHKIQYMFFYLQFD